MILYQLLMALALPVVLIHQALFGPPRALAERLGLAPPPGPGLRLWLHAASVGEATSARWVVAAVLAARPDLQVLVTCNTETGRAQVAGWGVRGVVAALAPLDTAGAAGRLLDRWSPQALVIVENELWPVRIAAADRRGVPVLVIGAKMSERSARRWRHFDRLIAATLRRIRWLSAQDAASAQRLRDLGLPASAEGPVVALKAIGHTTASAPPIAAVAPRSRTLLAASTHEGEEALVLQAFLAARDRFDHLILAPRHPKRSPEVQEMLRQRGVSFATRSAGAEPGPGTAVYLADTLGEMDHWYAMAGVCVIGGTFAPRGGHTPWEPARHGAAIVHGPSLHNFAPPFAALDRAGGAVAVADAPGLTAALQLMTVERQAALAQSATEVLAPDGDAGAVVEAILQAVKG